MTYTVYKIEYKGEIKYIGKTKQFNERRRQHIGKRGTKNSAIPIDVDLNDIEFMLIETFDNETDALKREDELIQVYNTINTGWNKCRSGLIWSDREFIKEKNRGYQKVRKEKEEYQQYQQEYRNEHRNQIKEKQREWYQLHKEELRKKNREYSRQYRQRKREQEKQNQ